MAYEYDLGMPRYLSAVEDELAEKYSALIWQEAKYGNEAVVALEETFRVSILVQPDSEENVWLTELLDGKPTGGNAHLTKVPPSAAALLVVGMLTELAERSLRT